MSLLLQGFEIQEPGLVLPFHLTKVQPYSAELPCLLKNTTFTVLVVAVLVADDEGELAADAVAVVVVFVLVTASNHG